MIMSFPDFSLSSVLVVGDVMIDRYWCGTTDRISSEAPIPIVGIKEIIDYPGGAANVAMNIAMIGGKSKLIGLIGVDEAAEILKKKLLISKVVWDLIPVHTCPTIIKLRVMSHNQQLIRLDFEKKFDDIHADQLVRRIECNLPNCKVLVLSDYNKGSLNKIEDIIMLARQFNVPIIIDPKGTQFSKYKGATLLTPNLSEFELVVGSCCSELDLVRKAKEVIVDYNLSALLITRAEKGMTLFKKNQDPLYFTSQSKEVYDVTGAGDTVIGILSAALSCGESLEKSCFLANLAAGVVIGKTGTSTLNEMEMKNVFYNCEYIKIPFGVLNEQDLKKAVSLVRARGEKIVMTNGVFDIIHYGHISYLTSAKKLGDKLIVAVNSDESTKRLKGQERPINTLEKRMLILASLSVVDWVVAFYEDTPVRLISEILPDVLVKGGDYHIYEIEGRKTVHRIGGTVSVLDFKMGYSSSKLIKIIKDNNKNKY